MRKVVWVSVSFLVACLFALCFQVMCVWDEALPVGSRSAFQVTLVQSQSKQQAIEVLDDIAEDLDVRVFKPVPNATDSFSSRTLYVFGADNQTENLVPGRSYPTFSPAYLRTSLASSDQIGTADLRGNYVTDATGTVLTALLRKLEAGGITAVPLDVSLVSVILMSLGQSNMAGTLAIVFVATVLALAFSVAQSRKAFALRVIHGYRRSSNTAAELYSFTRCFTSVVGIGLVLAGAGLGVYNGWNQWYRLVPILVVALAMSYLALSVAVVFALRLLGYGPVVQIIKGERAVMRLAAFAALVQIAVIALGVSSVAGAATRIQAIEAATRASTQWQEGPALYALRLSITGTHDDDMKTATGLEQIVPVMESEGKLLLSVHEEHPEPGVDPFEQGGARSLTVNNEYLRRQTVLGIDGQPVRDLPGSPDTFSLLVPDSFQGDRQALLDTYQQSFAASCRLFQEGTLPPCHPKGQIIEIRDGQSLVTFGQTAYEPIDMQDQAKITNPVLAVVNSGSGLIAPIDYLSYASNGHLLFEDATELDKYLETAGIAGAFQGIDNAADAVAASIQMGRNFLKMDLVSLAFGLVIMIASAAILAIVYCQRQQKILFVRLIHGYRFLARHWKYLLGAFVLSLAGSLIPLAQGTQTQPALGAIAAGFTLGQMLITLAAITIFEKQVRAETIKQ